LRGRYVYVYPGLQAWQTSPHSLRFLLAIFKFNHLRNWQRQA